MTERLEAGSPFAAPHDEAVRREEGVNGQNQALVALAGGPTLHSGNLADALREITETAADTLAVSQVGVWFFDEERAGIDCVSFFNRSQRTHTSGLRLEAKDFPNYFQAIDGTRALVVEDVMTDPATASLRESYLEPYQVRSLIDAPIRRLDGVHGIVCFEQTGEVRAWSNDEQRFASSIADLVAMAVDAMERRNTQEALRRRLELETIISGISSRFAQMEDDELDAEIDAALGQLGRFVGAERCHTILLAPDGLTGRMRHEWTETGEDLRSDIYGDLPAAAFRWWINELQEKQLFAFRSIEDIPAEAANERRILERYGIRSAVFVPMESKRKLLGSVGASTISRESDWPPETQQLFRLAGEIFANAIERSRAYRALRDSEARYRLMAENSTDIISRTSIDGTILYISDAVRSVLGYEPSELLGHRLQEYLREDDHHSVWRFMTDPHDARTFTYRIRRKDGESMWLESTTRAMTGPEGEALEIVWVSRDVSERRHAEEQIEYQAYHDALTGLPNRLLFRDRLTVALAHARRHETSLAVMFLDLDRFKNVNDTLGHTLGDELLRIVADRLRHVLREGDTIARMGGDEFTILLSDLRSAEDAAKIAQKLLDAVAEPMPIEGHELFVTTSIGISLYPDDGDSADSLLKNADNAMYRAKETGRNAFQLCTRAMNNRAAERLSVENSLRRAIERNELLIHFQPLIHLASRETVGMEALLRWERPGHGIVPPATFIDIAEETRLIVPIGEWVMRRACFQAKQWQRGAYPTIRVSVNLSPRQFQQADLVAVVADALDASELEPRFLELEITESTAMLNMDRTIATLGELHRLGVRIALDDFGTGHSSLNYLRRFPIDRLKIDREFVQEIERSRSTRAIIAAVVEMARGLDLAVTAEGVETHPQVDFLAAQGCEEVQGYLFGRPAPAA